MTRHFLFILTVFLLTNCNNISDKVEFKQKINPDLSFIDQTKLRATFLYDSNYIFNISVHENDREKFIGTSFGFYRKNGDTVFTSCPQFDSEEYHKIKTKYFWVARQHYEYNKDGKTMLDTSYIDNFFKEPYKLVDSLFNVKLSDTATIVFIPFPQDTLFIKNGKIVYPADKN